MTDEEWKQLENLPRIQKLREAINREIGEDEIKQRTERFIDKLKKQILREAGEQIIEAAGSGSDALWWVGFSLARPKICDVLLSDTGMGAS